MLHFLTMDLILMKMKEFKYLSLIFSLIILQILFGCGDSNSDDISIKELNYSDNIKIIKRSEWGWKQLENKKAEAEIKKITIHHGGVEFTRAKDSQEALRNLQQWSREEKGWIDIPYHFMIDLDGFIYEARPINYPGDTNTEYDPTGHALVEVMGNYEIQTLSESQLSSLIDIIVFLSREFDVPLSEIKTHKDYSSITDCPGVNIYKYFQDGTILSEVRKRLEGK